MRGRRLAPLFVASIQLLIAHLGGGLDRPLGIRLVDEQLPLPAHAVGSGEQRVQAVAEDMDPAERAAGEERGLTVEYDITSRLLVQQVDHHGNGSDQRHESRDDGALMYMHCVEVAVISVDPEC